jgi:hypothetical protein
MKNTRFLKNPLIKYSFLSSFLITSLLYTPLVAIEAASSPLPNIDYSSWSNMANNLETCTAGDFKLPVPEILKNLGTAVQMMKNSGTTISPAQMEEIVKTGYQNYEIKGWNGDKCQVILRVQAAQGALTLNCSFSKEDLPKLTNNAKQISTNIPPADASDNEVREIMNKSCSPTS